MCLGFFFSERSSYVLLGGLVCSVMCISVMCCAVLCCLCCAVLCCAVLCCAVLSVCFCYASDAADGLPCVDLVGRLHVYISTTCECVDALVCRLLVLTCVLSIL